MEQNENNHSSNHGYVYILSNPGMPGLLKIGMTRFDPTRRVQELSSATGVPTPFQLVYYREFHDCVAAELEIHSILQPKAYATTIKENSFLLIQLKLSILFYL